MFKSFINWFKGSSNEGWNGTVTTGDTSMKATILPVTGGKFALFSRTEGTIGTYARRRDAVRGAKRRGLTVA